MFNFAAKFVLINRALPEDLAVIILYWSAFLGTAKQIGKATTVKGRNSYMLTETAWVAVSVNPFE